MIKIKDEKRKQRQKMRARMNWEGKDKKWRAKIKSGEQR